MDITALLAAAVASFVIGWLWFSRFLFGSMWMRLTGVSSDGKRTAAPLVAGFVVEVVRAYVMAMVVAAMGAFSIATGVEAGFWIWLGFVATSGLYHVIYEKRPFALFAISYGYQLVVLLVIGAILATW